MSYGSVSECREMKESNLIIDLRHQRPWYRRYFSKTTTAIMWAAWLLLWRPFVLVWVLIELKQEHLLRHLTAALRYGVEQGLIALAVCVCGLLLWRLLPAKRVKSKHAVTKTLTDYARYFELPSQEIAEGRQQKVTTVYHDEHGKIVAVK